MYGIKKIEVVQDELNALVVKIIKEDKAYTPKSEKIFIQNWHDRIGSEMKLSLQYVNNIPVKKSGKYRIIKNNIKQLIPEAS